MAYLLQIGYTLGKYLREIVPRNYLTPVRHPFVIRAGEAAAEERFEDAIAAKGRIKELEEALLAPEGVAKLHVALAAPQSAGCRKLSRVPM